MKQTCEPCVSSEAPQSDEDEPPNPTAQPSIPFEPDQVKEHSYQPIHIVPAARVFEQIKASKRSHRFRQRYFPGVSANAWNDWRWQLQESVTNSDKLSRFIKLSEAEGLAFQQRRHDLPLRITPYYLSLIDQKDAQQPLRRCMVPVVDEFKHQAEENTDPLGEDSDSPVPGLIHRYPDRVLFLVSSFCAAHCRYCTRSRMIDESHQKSTTSQGRWKSILDYIAAHKEVRDVLLSGGDPLILPDEPLEYLLASLRAIPHVEMVRIGTKVPVVLPQRITRSLVRKLKKYHPLWMSIHCTHPDELTDESIQAFGRLADAGIPLGSQTVLLKDINDNLTTMRSLMHGLLKARVRPYYLYQCDPIIGSAHFRTPVQTGLDIIAGLRGFTSGYGVPHYVIDSPGGGGKIPLLPQYLQGKQQDDLILKNYQGKLFRYPDVVNSENSCSIEEAS